MRTSIKRMIVLVAIVIVLLMTYNSNLSAIIYFNAIEIYSNSNKIIEPKQSSLLVTSKLAKFDYENFQKKNALIKPIFDEVRAYLSEGKIKKLFKIMFSHDNDILNTLKQSQKKIKTNITLNKSKLWFINKYYSSSLLFVQHVVKNIRID